MVVVSGLAGQQLEGVDLLGGEQIPQRETVALAEDLIEAAAGVVRVDALRRIRVQRARIDIGAVRRDIGIGGEEPLDDAARGWIGRQRRPLVELGDQDVAVHAAANFLLAALEREIAAFPQRSGQPEPVFILVRGLHICRLAAGTEPVPPEAVLPTYIRAPDARPASP